MNWPLAITIAFVVTFIVGLWLGAKSLSDEAGGRWG